VKIRFLVGASKGCKALRDSLKEEGLDVLKIKKVGSRGIIREDIQILNDPTSVAKASDKVVTFQTLQEEGMSNYIPEWTTRLEDAVAMVAEGEVVYCRTLSRASQGRGIVIASETNEVVQAPLYTCKVDVSREVRIHVFGDRVIHFAQKKRMGSERREEEGISEANEDVRSHDNGWIFSISDVEIPQEAQDVAIRGVKALGLDFGAVDMALTPQGGCKIYEINTAPGLEGTTLVKYTEAFKDYVRNI